jgi:hypothetical protein
MKRVLLGFLTTLLAVALMAAGAAADSKKKKGGKKRAESAPKSAKIAESLGDLKWGASNEELLKKFTDKVKEKYRPLIAKTKDAVEEDRLRQEARQELDAIRKNGVQFDGRSTGWDVSFLKGEFTHNNDEAMIVVRDENSQNFYFFIGGKFWKWYKAFDASVFRAGDFASFAAAVQRKFGPAKEVKGELTPGEGERHWLEWQDDKSRLRAIDLSGFYGFYCLVFEEKSTVDQLAKLRSNTPAPADKRHALVESVTGERTADPDDAPNIADRITGKLRQSEQAPEGPSDSASASSKGKGKGKKGSSSSSESPVSSSDDPISGLGL